MRTVFALLILATVLGAANPAHAWYDRWGRWHPNYRRYYAPPYYAPRPWAYRPPPPVWVPPPPYAPQPLYPVPPPYYAPWAPPGILLPAILTAALSKFGTGWPVRLT